MRPHKKLKLWNESILFVEDIYLITAKFPDTEKFGLTTQLRRASVSIAANIAEGAARKTKKEFLHFLYISSGSLSEVDALLTIAGKLKYTSDENLKIADTRMMNISFALNGLIQSIRKGL